jgi:hypothetical protein
MADQAVVLTVAPLTVKLVDVGTIWPGTLFAFTAYLPVEGDSVTTLMLDNATMLVLGPWSQ